MKRTLSSLKKALGMAKNDSKLSSDLQTSTEDQWENLQYDESRDARVQLANVERRKAEALLLARRMSTA